MPPEAAVAEAPTQFDAPALEAAADREGIGEVKLVEIANIKVDDAMQMRATHESKDFLAAVTKYTEALDDGKSLPAVEVFEVIGGKHEGLYLVDGFARRLAHVAKEKTEIEAELVGRGSYKDARLYACGVNAEHGLPRSPADLHKSILEARSLLGKKGGSVRKIADVVKCHPSHVSRVLRAADGLADSTSGNKPTKPEKPAKDADPSDGAVGSVSVSQETPTTPVSLTDAAGKPIPDGMPELAKEFRAARLLEMVDSMRTEMASRILEACELLSQPKSIEALKEVVNQDLELLHKTLVRHTPHTICEHCDGLGCDKCSGRGWHPRA
jgi:hypothetical protein